LTCRRRSADEEAVGQVLWCSDCDVPIAKIHDIIVVDTSTELVVDVPLVVMGDVVTCPHCGELSVVDPTTVNVELCCGGSCMADGDSKPIRRRRR